MFTAEYSKELEASLCRNHKSTRTEAF